MATIAWLSVRSYQLVVDEQPQPDSDHDFADQINIHLREEIPVPARPEWYRDVRPVLLQFGNLYPIMSRHIVDLSNYDDVDYPGPLPMNIGEAGLIVGLEAFSVSLVQEVFMEIEQPEEPIVFPVPSVERAPAFATIGVFYSALAEKIRELGDGAFIGRPERQVVNPKWFAPDQLFAIGGVQSAVNAIDLIVKQGEGTPKTPLAPEGDLAHYYRFEQLVKGRRLVKDSTVPEGYSFSGPPISVDLDSVWNLKPNTKAAQIAGATEQRRLANEFNFTYARLLGGLQRTFDGDPAHLDATLGLMYDLKLLGERLATMELPGQSGLHVGPGFEHVGVNL